MTATAQQPDCYQKQPCLCRFWGAVFLGPAPQAEMTKTPKRRQQFQLSWVLFALSAYYVLPLCIHVSGQPSWNLSKCSFHSTLEPKRTHKAAKPVRKRHGIHKASKVAAISESIPASELGTNRCGRTRENLLLSRIRNRTETEAAVGVQGTWNQSVYSLY